jgi:hypothetical protein
LVHVYQTSSVFPGYFPIGLCQFRITLLTPLQCAHHFQVLGFVLFPYFSCTCSPLSVWLMSNNITTFVLDLKSPYEGEHAVFDLLSVANLA